MHHLDQKAVHDIITFLTHHTIQKRIKWNALSTDLNNIGFSHSCFIRGCEYRLGRSLRSSSDYRFSATPDNICGITVSVDKSWGTVYGDVGELYGLIDQRPNYSLLNRLSQELSELCPFCLKEPRSQHVNGDCP